MKNETLIAARKQSGKTQKQVAQKSAIATIAYQSYERGTRTPIVTTAIKIANALGVKDFQEFCELWGTTPYGYYSRSQLKSN